MDLDSGRDRAEAQWGQMSTCGLENGGGLDLWPLDPAPQRGSGLNLSWPGRRQRFPVPRGLPERAEPTAAA